MFYNTFYHSLTRQLAIVTGNMFNDIVIRRLDKTGKRLQTITVPISYSPKRKQFIAADTRGTDRAVEIQLPRMGFTFNSWRYDADRSVVPLNKISSPTKVINEKYNTFAAIPYKISCEVYAIAKNTDDAMQIFEQIVPYFTPSISTSMKLVPELNHTFDVIHRLTDTSFEDVYDGQLLQRQMLIWNFTFEIDFWYFGPSVKSGVIKRLTLNTGERTAYASDSISIGMTANNTPTGDYTQSINPLLISDEDDYGFTLESKEKNYGNA